MGFTIQAWPTLISGCDTPVWFCWLINVFCTFWLPNPNLSLEGPYQDLSKSLEFVKIRQKMRLVWFVQFLQSTKQGRPVTRVWHSVFCLSYESGTQHTSRRWQRLVQHELQSTCLVITPAWSLVFIFLIELVQKATLPKEHLGYITTLQRLNTKMSLFSSRYLDSSSKLLWYF
jgi:hypothetical protein